MFQRHAKNPDFSQDRELSWESMIPPVDTDPGSKDALIVWEWLPLEVGLLWFDFSKIDFSTAYCIGIQTVMDDGSTRPLFRADVTFAKPEPGWPVAVLVNGAPQRLDGLLDIGFGLYPFSRQVKIVQTKGRATVVRVCHLTGVTQPASVQA